MIKNIRIKIKGDIDSDMNKNKGKVFEDDVKKSCQRDGIFVDRVRDNATSYFDFGQTDSAYSKENPYDFHIYKYPHLMCLELKHTKYTSMSIQRNKQEDKSKMIKAHQIEALTRAASHHGIKAGFLLSFYNGNTDQESTYYMAIENFNNFLNSEDKKSINMIDMAKYGCIKVDQVKLRTHYHYDIAGLFEKI